MDSFYFTNITPQMDDFNQSVKGGLWGRLEDAVFDDALVDGLKISVFGGPVFRENDRIFRDVKVPREYWKVIVFVEDHNLKAKAFILTQNLNDLEVLELDEFRVYQVALTEIEDRCGLRFSAALKAADKVGAELSHLELPERRPIDSLQDINWS
jgi:endonuclease G